MSCTDTRAHASDTHTRVPHTRGVVPHTYVFHTRATYAQANLSADVICDVPRQINADYDDCTWFSSRKSLIDFFPRSNNIVKASRSSVCGVLSRGGGRGLFFNKLNLSPFPQVKGKSVWSSFKFANFGYSPNSTLIIHIIHLIFSSPYIFWSRFLGYVK